MKLYAQDHQKLADLLEALDNLREVVVANGEAIESETGTTLGYIQHDGENYYTTEEPSK